MKKIVLVLIVVGLTSCSHRVHWKRGSVNPPRVLQPQPWTQKDKRICREWGFLGFSFRFYLSQNLTFK